MDCRIFKAPKTWRLCGYHDPYARIYPGYAPVFAKKRTAHMNRHSQGSSLTPVRYWRATIPAMLSTSRYLVAIHGQHHSTAKLQFPRYL